MITITPHIEICDKWLDPSVANINRTKQREEIRKAANEYIDKTLTFQADARGKEIKRDLRGILEYRKTLKDYLGLPDPETISQDKARLENVEYLFSCIRKGLTDRAKEDQSGTYQFLTADDVKEWEKEFDLKSNVLDIFSFPEVEKVKKV